MPLRAAEAATLRALRCRMFLGARARSCCPRRWSPRVAGAALHVALVARRTPASDVRINSLRHVVRDESAAQRAVVGRRAPFVRVALSSAADPAADDRA